MTDADHHRRIKNACAAMERRTTGAEQAGWAKARKAAGRQEYSARQAQPVTIVGQPDTPAGGKRRAVATRPAMLTDPAHRDYVLRRAEIDRQLEELADTIEGLTER